MKKSILAMVTVLCFIGMIGFANAATLVYSNPSLGDHSAAMIFISLTGLAAHSKIDVSFDLYIMDSWDGSSGGYGPDWFGFSVDFDHKRWTFDNFNYDDETNTSIATATGNFNSVNSWGEIDRYFQNYGGGFTFSHSASTLYLDFYDLGLQGLDDESWRVTNLAVYSDAGATVPEPATMLLFGLGLMGVAGMRRKFQV